MLKVWSGRRGSNPRHPAWEAGVLPLNYSRSLPKSTIANLHPQFEPCSRNVLAQSVIALLGSCGGKILSLADADRGAIRVALGRIRKKVEQVSYHLDSTETAQDSLEALREAQRTASQIVTDLGLLIERVQARQES